MNISRRGFIMGMPLVMAGCVTHERLDKTSSQPLIDPSYTAMYASIDNEPYPVPAVDLKRVKPQFLRREVDYETKEQPGTIIVDPSARYAYLVGENGRALRYGVGVGKQEAFNFQGEATIARKAEWPGWRPTDNMIAREPERYGPLKDGLPGGSRNPLGPRALYLYRDGRDTYYRLHGTVEPWTIGTMVSSGCIRLLNQDIIDLYRRTPVGTKVVVLPIGSTVT
ncbi:Lipoprotein-anchoring transpeptidase ErfK/SrfK [Rhizobium sp. AN5]|uniref:L,D-transpeptidase n=1 Tax=Rhizobium sp. AN5 TaxID=1855304 RepID=UPI000BCDE23B|nr:L,D-transpeptidase [Rhizobium sp. AN5]SOC92274.1 Lipoprotein-anchoring transpeptidase ErfK/SrfK [Rhizobium sp. AN5]